MSIVDFLTSRRAREAMEDFVDRPFEPARDVPRLRGTFDIEEVRALADMVVVRDLARRKFGPHADAMVYSAEAVRQATPWQVAKHRSRRYSTSGAVADLGCGIGGDAMWLGPTVVGVDIDSMRLGMARHNAAVVGVELWPIRADLTHFGALDVDEAFADPGRRDESGRRIFDVERYRPPLGVLLERWTPTVAGLGVKLHPGVDRSTLPKAEIEFVSLQGELKEACLWLGSLSGTSGTRATVLPSGATIIGQPLEVTADVGAVSTWLYEPDPAVIRAGLVGDVAVDLGLGAIDPTIAYLTGSAALDSPFVTGYRVDEVMPFNGKRIKAELRRRNIGSVTVKKRGSAVEPEQFRRRLDLSGDDHCIVVLTRSMGKPVAILCVGD